MEVKSSAIQQRKAYFRPLGLLIMSEWCGEKAARMKTEIPEWLADEAASTSSRNVYM